MYQYQYPVYRAVLLMETNYMLPVNRQDKFFITLTLHAFVLFCALFLFCKLVLILNIISFIYALCAGVITIWLVVVGYFVNIQFLPQKYKMSGQ